MLTSSHAYWAIRLTRPGSRRRSLLLGAVAPDLPAYGAAAVLLARGRASSDLVAAIYHRGVSRHAQIAAHSLAAWVLAYTGSCRHSPRRSFALGGLSHLAVDVLSHHDDAWPLLWPLSVRVWRSPLSYWQLDHGARWWSAGEILAIGAAAATDTAAPRRALAVPAVALAAAPLWRGFCRRAVGLAQ